MIKKPNAAQGNELLTPAAAPNKKRKKKPAKPYRKLRIAAWILGIALLLECLYCFVVFTNNPTIRSLREAYIETAMSTMSHHWLAE